MTISVTQHREGYVVTWDYGTHKVHIWFGPEWPDSAYED